MRKIRKWAAAIVLVAGAIIAGANGDLATLVGVAASLQQMED